MAEGVAIALDSVRANKVRAALTILGVAIGVTVVIAMGVGHHGHQPQHHRASSESAGPKTFFVAAVLPRRPRHLRRVRRALAVAQDAVDHGGGGRADPPAPRRCSDVSIGEDADGPVSFEGVNLKSVQRRGHAARRWVQVNGGDILAGRTFTPLEYAAGARVAVINDKLADMLFPGPRPDRQDDQGVRASRSR